MPKNYGGYTPMLKKHNDAGPKAAVTGAPRKLPGKLQMSAHAGGKGSKMSYGKSYK